MTWHPQLDNPTFLGWSVVAGYLLAAVSCASVGLRTSSSARKIWWLLGLVLLFLGINKQLNLQTLLIVLGRRAALAGGWYDHRRLVQVIFCVVFGLAGLAVFLTFAVTARDFIRKNKLAFAGIIVLLAFVVLRSSSINHLIELFGMNLKDGNWAWALELCGSFLITAAAAAAAKSAPGTGPEMA